MFPPLFHNCYDISPPFFHHLPTIFREWYPLRAPFLQWFTGKMVETMRIDSVFFMRFGKQQRAGEREEMAILHGIPSGKTAL